MTRAKCGPCEVGGPPHGPVRKAAWVFFSHSLLRACETARENSCEASVEVRAPGGPSPPRPLRVAKWFLHSGWKVNSIDNPG